MSSAEPNMTSSGARIQYQFKRYRLILTGVSFILMLLMPALDQIFSFSAGFESTEKRILAPVPTFRFPHVKTFIAEFNQYFKENFGWRNALFYQYSHWKYYVLHLSPLPEKVVVGKRGWFYPGNSLNNVANQHRGFSPFSPAKLQAIVSHLTTIQQQLADQHAQLYLFVAPDSYSIYPENVPDNFQIRSGPKNLDLLQQALRQHTSIPFIDPRPALVRAKDRHVIYRQTDTHWNNYGALVASLSLIERLRQDFPTIPEVHLSNYRVQPQHGVGGDLTTMIALNREQADSVEYRIEAIPSLRATETERIENSFGKLPNQRFMSPNRDGPSLLLLGDSYTYSMNQFVPGYFSKTLIVRPNQFDIRQVEQEKPAIVVIEIAERDIALLADL